MIIYLIYFYVCVYVCCLHWRINVFKVQRVRDKMKLNGQSEVTADYIVSYGTRMGLDFDQLHCTIPDDHGVSL